MLHRKFVLTRYLSVVGLLAVQYSMASAALQNDPPLGTSRNKSSDTTISENNTEQPQERNTLLNQVLQDDPQLEASGISPSDTAKTLENKTKQPQERNALLNQVIKLRLSLNFQIYICQIFLF